MNAQTPRAVWAQTLAETRDPEAALLAGYQAEGRIQMVPPPSRPKGPPPVGTAAARAANIAKGIATRSRVLEIIAAAPHGVTLPDLQRDTGLHYETLRTLVRTMQRRGEIVRRGTRGQRVVFFAARAAE